MVLAALLRFGPAIIALGLLCSACSPSAPPPPPPPQVKLDTLDPALAETITSARKTVIASPTSADGWGKLGQALNAAEFFAAAQTCYSRAAELDPKAARWPHLLGLLQLQDEPDAALTNLVHAVDLAGTETDAPRVRLAQALVERGLYDEAVTNLQTLLVADSGHVAARLEMARIHLARNQPDQAFEFLLPCLTNAYTARPALLLLSQVRQRQGKTDEAAAFSRRAMMIPRPYDWPDPFLREVQSLRTDLQKLQDKANALLIQKRLPEADAALAVLFRAFPDDPEGRLLLGRLRYLERKCPDAEEAFRQYLALRTNALNGLIQLALAQLCQEHWTNAIATLQEAIALKPDFAQAHYNLGFAFSRAGDSTSAIQSYREALRCNPGDSGTHATLAEELIRTGARGEAAYHLDRALALNPGNQKARDLLQRLSK